MVCHFYRENWPCKVGAPVGLSTTHTLTTRALAQGERRMVSRFRRGDWPCKAGAPLCARHAVDVVQGGLRQGLGEGRRCKCMHTCASPVHQAAGSLCTQRSWSRVQRRARRRASFRPTRQQAASRCGPWTPAPPTWAGAADVERGAGDGPAHARAGAAAPGDQVHQGGPLTQRRHMCTDHGCRAGSPWWAALDQGAACRRPWCSTWLTQPGRPAPCA